MNAQTAEAAGPAETCLTKALKKARNILRFVGLFSFFINLLMLVGPIYMLQIYDRVLTSGSLPTLLYLTLAAACLILISALLEWVRARILVRLGGQLDSEVNGAMFSGMLRRALASGNSRPQALRDLETLRSFLTGPGLLAFFDAPWTPIFLLTICLLHPLLGLIAFLGAVMLFSVAITNEILTRKPLADAAAANMSAVDFAESNLRNAEIIEALGMRPALEDRWRERHQKALVLQAEASDKSGVTTALSKFIRPVLQVAILGAGAYLALQQVITPGAMVAASILMGRALAPVEAAINHWRNFVLARGSYARVQDFLRTHGEDEETMPLPRPKGAIAVEKLVAAPPGGTMPVIKGISFRIEPGEAVGVIGPSAAGKSTLARLLIGVWRPSSGHVRLDGADITSWDHVNLGPHLGYMPQDVELFEGKVADNIARFGDPDPEKVVAAARQAGVHELILRLENGYDTDIGAGGAILSAGQRQRIGLARAIYGEPALVVLDEPNSNLDGEGEEALRNALQGLKAQGATAVIIAHRPSVLSVVDKLMVLKEGMIEHFGPREDVLPKITRAVPGGAGAGREPDAARKGETGQ